MKILHTADWHIGQFKGPVADGVNLRLQDTINCLNYLVEVAEEEKPDYVCISGDIFHQEQVGPLRYSEEMIIASNIISHLSQLAKFVFVMRGTPNHDGGGQFRVLHQMLQHISNVKVITVPAVFNTGDASFVCIPGFDRQEFRAKFPGLSADEENEVWTEYISATVSGLRAMCKYTPILMAHYTVPGCNLESGQTSFFSNFEPVIPREAIEAAQYEAALLGHIHRPQMIEGLHNVFYSGAINALNFNDEGQSRGFWIHEFDSTGKLVKGHRYDTPYRKFQTINWDYDDVDNYLREGKMFILSGGIPDLVSDKIVRLNYNCTSEQKKQLNISMLQKDLYDSGAFWVSDITAENMIDVANRGLLSEESDPRMNLKRYLNEKAVKDADKITELAEPIISNALKQVSTTDTHGVFRPVSIKVKNYRNYKEESFDFTDISFCTINGVNGAGKSSLFMDAIVDCLYEETREGDNKAWIRGTDDARSGMIEFVFEIGDKRFRVTRTRTKSGKPTLNFSQKSEDGIEWMNLSRERIADTQAEIIRILGMDSLTFRSCALIMQDQYGLFLQAKKEERITVLGNLLGLWVYQIMENEARVNLASAKREIASKKESMRTKEEFISEKGNPEEELEQVEEALTALELKAAELEEKKSRAISIQTDISSAEEKLIALEKEKLDNQSDIGCIAEKIIKAAKAKEGCEAALSREDEIKGKAREYREVSKRIMQLEKDKIRCESERKALEEVEAGILKSRSQVNRYTLRNSVIDNALDSFRFRYSVPLDIEEKLEKLKEVRKAAADQTDKKYKASIMTQEIIREEAMYREGASELKATLKRKKDELEACRLQKVYMENSGCPDPENAKCKFLEKAISDVKKITNLEADVKEREAALSKIESNILDWKSKKENEKAAIGYDENLLLKLLDEGSELEKYETIKRKADEQKAEISRLQAEKESNSKNIAEYEKSLSEGILKAQEINDTIDTLMKSVRTYNLEKLSQESLEHFAKLEQELPVYAERAKNTENEITRLEEEKRDAEAKKGNIAIHLEKIKGEIEKLHSAQLEYPLSEISDLLKANSAEIQELQVRKGILMQRKDDVEHMKAEIAMLKAGLEVMAVKATGYEILKQAFSQDGVPHQIIRNIIPHITDTANNILGSMTGGAMGIEFVMERTVKGKDGDKPALDVLINEYGKTTLPYASKSGGEKVKASLAVILALSEIKASAAGIQLGMLFIDEPPFLDEDGAQAYVDSLETIRRRCPDVKVMAITHDDAMKARFVQNVTVIKTDEGSKVIY